MESGQSDSVESGQDAFRALCLCRPAPERGGTATDCCRLRSVVRRLEFYRSRAFHANKSRSSRCGRRGSLPIERFMAVRSRENSDFGVLPVPRSRDAGATQKLTESDDRSPLRNGIRDPVALGKLVICHRQVCCRICYGVGRFVPAGALRLSEILRRAVSTSRTVTFTICPTATTSDGSRTK